MHILNKIKMSCRLFTFTSSSSN